jgi:hypothetical protein
LNSMFDLQLRNKATNKKLDHKKFQVVF